ncbi:MAG: 16S rRNA (guanine(527)-N(7))-methyltransferase RsmG [Candidatus Wallbacteria bacterium]|nr:16S rRNA (guanine(527)-N(7))-methyltransferase RsmG [Candidatus Wallbacteria bacterium]
MTPSPGMAEPASRQLELRELLGAIFAPFAAENGVALGAGMLEALAAYGAFLLDENTRMNLTAARDAAELVRRHLCDAVPFASGVAPRAAARLADVGSGAGLPGIPLAVLQPDVEVTLVESVGKKAAFLSRVQEHLKLQNVRVVCVRAEELGRHASFRGRYDVVTLRACAELRVALEFALPLVRQGGLLLAPKGPAAGGEIDAARTALRLLGGTLAEVTEYRLPQAAVAFHMIHVEKSGPTPALYPRPAAQISRRPL